MSFLEQTLDNLGNIRVGSVRLDSGFYSKNILQYLENKSLNYIVSVRFYPPLKELIRSKQNRITLVEGVEVATTTYKSSLWEKPRRLVLVRQDLKYRPKVSGKQLLIPFEDTDTLYRHYQYSPYVTNLDLPAAEVWRLYRHRAEAENKIKGIRL